MTGEAAILYLSGTLPTRSETFVYREIFALRELGWTIKTASVHTPGKALGDQKLDRLAQETIAIYARKPPRIISDISSELIRRPVRTAGTIARALADVCFSNEVRGVRRLKVVWQCLAALSLANRLRQDNVQHIHSHMAHVPTTIAMYCARQLGIGFSFTGHANDLFPNRTLLTEKLGRAMWVNCISEWHHAFYQSLVQRPATEYPIVRCGVDTTELQMHRYRPDLVLKVLGVGRLVEKKGFDVLIEAVGDLVTSEGIAIRVQIAGSGPQEERLRGLIDALPSGAAVELLGDTPNSRVLELMAESDVFVLPCRVAQSGDRDGIPVVLMEAMALGRCVVTGDLETIRELVVNGQSGLMVRPGDRGDVTEALRRLAANRELLAGFGQRARERIEEEFDLTLNAKRIVAVMQSHGIGIDGEGD